jgi:putative protein kinase ArgK-like GTPase of G3E family
MLTLALLVLSACSSTPSTPNSTASAPVTTTETASPASPETQAANQPPVSSTSNTNDTQAGFTGLQQVVDNTTSAIEADDFAKAKQEFGQFETYWQTVEDGVKAKSASTYKIIEDEMDNVTNGLRAPNPNKAKLLANLKSLSSTLKNYP